MDPKGRPDTQTNWSTDCRPQDALQLQLQSQIQGGVWRDRLSQGLYKTEIVSTKLH
jgi:hypothetical protein